MSKPDIRVRLTAEGVKEVIDAIRAVRQESAQAEKSSRALSSAAGVLRGTLGALGITASITGLIGVGKAAIGSASEVNNLAKSLGLTAEEFSRLAYAAQQFDIQQSTLGTGLENYQRLLSDAVTKPNGEAAASFKQLGLDARTLRRLSLTDQLKTIADRVAGLSSQEDKARASTDLFGRALGPSFVRVLAEGADGIRRLADESDRLGATLSNKAAAQIDRTDAAIKRLKATTTGWIREALASVSEEMLGAPNLGPAERVADLQKEIIRLQGLNRFQRLWAGDVDKNIAKRQAQIADIQRVQQLGAWLRPILRPQPSGSSSLIPVETDADRKAALDATQKRIDAQLRITQEGFKEQEAAAKSSYDRGITSLESYYSARRAIIESAVAAEIAANQAKIAALKAAPAEDDAAKAQRARAIEEQRAQIELRRLQTANELKELDRDELADRKKLNDAAGEFYARLAELEGDRHAVFQHNLDEETEKLVQMLTQLGATQEEIADAIDRLTNGRAASFRLDEAERSAKRALDSFNRDADQIRRDQDAGLISQQEAERRLIELEKQRLEVLRAQADALLAAAQVTGDQEKIAQAQAYADSIAEIDRSLRAATDSSVRLRVALKDSVEQGLDNLFTDAFMGRIRSVGDAFEALADTVRQALARILADLLRKQLLEALSNLRQSIVGSGQSSSLLGAGYGGGGTVMAARGGHLRRLAGGGALDVHGGGMLVGPGTPTSDSMLLWGSRDEFMVRAAATQQPGGLALLHAINQGRVTAARIHEALRGMEMMRGLQFSLPRFAAGGALSGAPPADGWASGRRGDVNVSMPLHPAPGTDSAAFQSMIDRAIPRIAEIVRAAVSEDAYRQRGVWGGF